MKINKWKVEWNVDTIEDGRIELTAPTGIVLMTVSPETADMLGRMLINEAGIDEDWV